MPPLLCTQVDVMPLDTSVVKGAATPCSVTRPRCEDENCLRKPVGVQFRIEKELAPKCCFCPPRD